jgi:hypothetical protein
MAGENPGNGSAKTLINRGLKNLKHGKMHLRFVMGG